MFKSGAGVSFLGYVQRANEDSFILRIEQHEMKTDGGAQAVRYGTCASCIKQAVRANNQTPRLEVSTLSALLRRPWLVLLL